MSNINNSGYRNSGYRNSGNFNSGNFNSGNHNSGNFNSGNFNSGNHNSGSYNSDNFNSGSYNSGSYNSGFFNTDEPNVRLFNKDTNLKRSQIILPYINLKLTEWIPTANMTEEQKKNDPNFDAKEGTLITRTYHEAWELYWKSISDKIKQQFLDLPNFDPKIFKEITGIDVEKPDSCNGKVVEIDGKKYRLEELK